MTIDPSRAVRACALLAWAAFFLYLWVSGQSVEYVGRRTAWVVPFGAIVLGVCALIYLPTVRVRARAQRPSITELASAAALVAPLLVLFVVPSPRLGALAAERKGGDDARRAIAPPDRGGDSQITLADLAWATTVPEFRQSRGIRDGVAVDVTGFVSKVRYDQIEVSRFQVSCCAADAIPYSVQVRGRAVGQGHAKDSWVRVRGKVAIGAGPMELSVSASRVDGIPEPDDPYAEY
jgi:uncharacterized repeat protein (TIGR03943 family)